MVEKFVGLTKKSAQDLADRNNLIFRLISIDNEPYMGYPEDERTDRVCVEIVKGVITKAVLN